MATTYTTNLKLGKPAISDTGWNVPLNANIDSLEAAAPLSGLVVTTAEVPSSSLYVSVAPGSYRKGSGSLGTYAGTGSQLIGNSVTRVLYLDSSSALHVGSSYPTSGAYVPLATVVTGNSTITSVTDNRVSACEIRANLVAAANDSAAASAGVSIGGMYQDTTGIVRVRLT